jgi:hypothetical protein
MYDFVSPKSPFFTALWGIGLGFLENVFHSFSHRPWPSDSPTCLRETLRERENLMVQIKNLHIEIVFYCTDKFEAFKETFPYFNHLNRTWWLTEKFISRNILLSIFFPNSIFVFKQMLGFKCWWNNLLTIIYLH